MRTSNKYPFYCFVAFLVVWAALAINPVDRFTWFLENIIVFISVPAVVFVHFKFRLSNTACTLITIYLILHAIGSHYTYSETPFFSSIFGQKLQRDHYDRLTHFTFGLLMYYPVREFIRKFVSMSSFWSYYLPLAIIVSFSAIYELMEWTTAIIVSPENAVAFIGMQGDIFDSQKDILLAATGAITTMAFSYVKNTTH